MLVQDSNIRLNPEEIQEILKDNNTFADFDLTKDFIKEMKISVKNSGNNIELNPTLALKELARELEGRPSSTPSAKERFDTLSIEPVFCSKKVVDNNFTGLFDYPLLIFDFDNLSLHILSFSLIFCQKYCDF